MGEVSTAYVLLAFSIGYCAGVVSFCLLAIGIQKERINEAYNKAYANGYRDAERGVVYVDSGNGYTGDSGMG